MASNESLHSQVIDAIVASLTGITGDGTGATYWDTPGAVVGVDFFEDALLDRTIAGPIYAVRAGEELHAEGQTGDVIARVEAEMDVFVLCLQALADDLLPFAQRDPPRRKVVDRMVRDVLRKLLVDVRLLAVPGSSVNNIFASPVIVDRDRFVSGWAIAEIHFRVAYNYGGSTP